MSSLEVGEKFVVFGWVGWGGVGGVEHVTTVSNSNISYISFAFSWVALGFDNNKDFWISFHGECSLSKVNLFQLTDTQICSPSFIMFPFQKDKYRDFHNFLSSDLDNIVQSNLWE